MPSQNPVKGKGVYFDSFQVPILQEWEAMAEGASRSNCVCNQKGWRKVPLVFSSLSPFLQARILEAGAVCL